MIILYILINQIVANQYVAPSAGCFFPLFATI